MRFFIIALVAIMIGSVIYLSIRKNMNKKNKIILIALFVIILINVEVYTFIQKGNNKKDADIMANFMRGETIECQNLTINNKNFNFISGTLSFIGKKDTEFSGKIIPIEQCH